MARRALVVLLLPVVLAIQAYLAGSLEAGAYPEPPLRQSITVPEGLGIEVYRVGEGRVLPAAWGPAAAVDYEVYTPAGSASLPCLPDWLAASSDGSSVYALCQHGTLLYMIQFGKDGGASVRAYSLPAGYKAEARAALVYLGTLYIPLVGPDGWGYLVAHAASGFVQAFTGLREPVAPGPEGTPLPQPAASLPAIALWAPDGASAVYIVGFDFYVYRLGSALEPLEPGRAGVKLAAPLEGGGVVAVFYNGTAALQTPDGGWKIIVHGVEFIYPSGGRAIIASEGEWLYLYLGPNGYEVFGILTPPPGVPARACPMPGFAGVYYLVNDSLNVIVHPVRPSPGPVPILWIRGNWSEGSRVYCSRDGALTAIMAGPEGRELVLLYSENVPWHGLSLAPLAASREGAALYYTRDGLELNPDLPQMLAPPGAAALGVRAPGSLPSYTFQYTAPGQVAFKPDPGVPSAVLLYGDGEAALSALGGGEYAYLGPGAAPDQGYLVVPGGTPPFSYELLGLAFHYKPRVEAFLARVYLQQGHVRITGIDPAWVEVLVLVFDRPLAFGLSFHYSCHRGGWAAAYAPPGSEVVSLVVAAPGLGAGLCQSATVSLPGLGDVGATRIVARAVLGVEDGVLASYGRPVEAEYYAQQGPGGLLAWGSGPVALNLSSPYDSRVLAYNAKLTAYSGLMEINVTVPSLSLTLSGSARIEEPPEPEEPPREWPYWLAVMLAAGGGVMVACLLPGRLYYSRR